MKWSDETKEVKTNPWENIPDERYRPDRIVEAKEDSCNDELELKNKETIRQADFSDCPYRYTCLSDALKLLRNQMSERDALIFIARFYYKLKLKDLESIFRLDLTNISRVAQKAERKLKVRG